MTSLVTITVDLDRKLPEIDDTLSMLQKKFNGVLDLHGRVSPDIWEEKCVPVVRELQKAIEYTINP